MENNENDIINLQTNEQDEQTTNPELLYTITQVIGKGTFGIVYGATINKTNETVAIKKVFQDVKYKNRELELMKILKHPNVVTLRNYYFTQDENNNGQYLHCVMDFVPGSLSNKIRSLRETREQMEMLTVKLLSFQMCRALAYIRALGICHRDIKPQNILIDTDNNILKLCDFGSAKIIKANEKNHEYICSRYYRAPELIFGSHQYSFQVDMWSLGCIIAELVLGRPLFPGKDSSDQLVVIIKVLGTPTKEEIYKMNPECKDRGFPVIPSLPWERVFKRRKVNESYLDLISKLLIYEPDKRLTPLQAICHPFFDELKDSKTILPNGKGVPKELFEFTQEEINSDQESINTVLGQLH